MRGWPVVPMLLLTVAGCLDSDEPILAPEPDVPPESLLGMSCPDDVVPAAPAAPVTAPGPGPGMVTVSWSPPGSDIPVTGYVLYRDGEPLPLANTLSFGDHAPSDREYQVAAVDACGNEGPLSAATTGSPLPGGGLTAVATSPLNGVRSDELASWPVLDATGNQTGNATWRIVEGTGNCCENYVVTTPTGRIIDFGGTFLHYSDDEGITWQTVGTIPPYGTGEGAVVVGPGGDVLAVGWDPYSGDQLWSHKYVAADDQWHYQFMPLHQPFFDRAWVTAVKGPFTIAGQTVPYLTFVESNFHGSLAPVLLRSLDGLHYESFSEAGLGTGEGGVTLPELPYDADRDWMQPISPAPVRPIGNGLGLQRTGLGQLAGCELRVLTETGAYACPTGLDVGPSDPILSDAQGNLHVIGHGALYSMSPDGGNTWRAADFQDPLPGGENDFKVSAHLDRALYAVHANLGDGKTGDYVIVFRNITTQPVFDRIYQVGAWDSGSDSGLGGERRFDFMSAGFLPDGRIVMSFTDADHHPPALAILQP